MHVFLLAERVTLDLTNICNRPSFGKAGQVLAGRPERRFERVGINHRLWSAYFQYTAVLDHFPFVHHVSSFSWVPRGNQKTTRSWLRLRARRFRRRRRSPNGRCNGQVTWGMCWAIWMQHTYGTNGHISGLRIYAH